MPRAYRHLTWRVVDPDRMKTSSLDSELQTLVPNEGTSWPGAYRWTTVARGNGIDLAAVAEALNRARFTLFDIRPVKSSTEKRR
jgi:hypothetical protein